MDLIPASYRLYVTQVRICRKWGMAFGLLTVICLLIIVLFKNMNSTYVEEIAFLEKQKAISSHQRGILEGLQADYEQLSEKQNILLKLRGGVSANEMFVYFDMALDAKKVWFTSWEFSRAGGKTTEKPNAVNTGYFIVLPAGADSETEQQTWKIQTHMAIAGQAVDHEALSDFVRNLIKQKQIHDVRVLNTQRTKTAGHTVVDFNIVVVVNAQVDSA